MHSPVFLALLGTGFIFLMSSLGAARVFLYAGGVRLEHKSILLGFTAGVMTAASVWSLLIPAMEQQSDLGFLPCWLPAAAGLLLGSGFLAGLDRVFLRRQALTRTIDPSAALLVSSITLHNIPEGMAVGLAFALAADGESLAAAIALSLGIGIQNLPEGAAASLPLRQLGLSRSRSFFIGLASAAVEPIFGVGVVFAAALVHPLMQWFLSFAAGAMLYVTVHELIPQSPGEKGSFSFIGGFLLMMILDVALG